MKIIAIEEAVGKKIGHELTGIIPGKKENITYLKGYVIKEEDIDILKNMGKYHINILDEDSSLVHENDGAIILGEKLIGSGISVSSPKEGKVHGYSNSRGVLVSNWQGMKNINLTDGLKFATKANYAVVEEKEKVATASITPLEIEEEILNGALKDIDNPLVEVIPINNKKKIGLITTGTEVFEGRIKDAFLPYLKGKVDEFGYLDLKQVIVRDDYVEIAEVIDSFINDGYDLIFLTGGLSVDADDYTLKAVKEHEGMDIVTYGSPVFPGAMFLAAYYNDKLPFIGLPAGLLRGGRSILDLVLPLLMAEVKITKEFIASLGCGGIL